MNLAAPPPAKKQATASGRSEGQQRLEFDIGERQAEFLDDGAARLGVAVPEALEGFIARGVLPGDPHRALQALVHHGLAESERRLAVGERGAEHVGRAQRTRRGMHARIRDQVQHAAFARHALYAHLHAGVHGADQNVDLVTLHQPVGVLHALGRLRLVVHLEPLDLAATELAALFADRHAHAVLDGDAQLREGAGVGQHEADADLVGLRTHDLGQQQSGGSRSDDGGTAGEDEAAGGHG
jgi:hypothetical protein